MKTIVPDYYTRFRCLMGACRHTCCAGWEIDIDEESRARFLNVPGDFGSRIRESMAQQDGVYSFILREDERCPFLREDGLCDMILHLGKDSLCQICADHPRFRNHYSDRTEMGLGLCCEAAAQLILTNPQPVRLTIWETDGKQTMCDPEEQALLQLREKWMRMAQDRSLSFVDRFKLLEQELLWPLPGPTRAFVPFLLSLERLDDSWAEQLNQLNLHHPLPLPDDFDIPLEQLMVYLLYRHVPAAMEDGDADARLAFCLFICRLVMDVMGCCLARDGHITEDQFCELCRMASSEIEYSDENLFALFDALTGT